MSMTERKMILKLEEELKRRKYKLFNKRLLKIVDQTEKDLVLNGIIGFPIISIDNDEFTITYTHRTKNYSEDNYNYISDDDSDGDDEENKNLNDKNLTYNEYVENTITFGKEKKFFIKLNNNDSRYSIYNNSSGELRIINKDYSVELDISQQKTLIEKYSHNKDIPEFLAIRFFLFMCLNEWNHKDIIINLSIV